ncbi:MAG: glucose-1-phosphate thymidylyltransferase RfbA [Rhodococcus sp. (in: high G+C Gram-positive bacteria)]|jgi:glucose-1-phosphate thymidylyltransferase|uniref:glucose-1-phosphate thymidylyltransferase RfbA n=1 Tax=Rhodococcus sp. EPR-157 TaxID=1813677 RepID=UPI0007BBB7CA|nr:glucose-1-phosphate thymidylyltransferase RfbA [Rhodococcus sp. EPR-157]KZF00608.1 glucose-1-phosphate thymidylyltransferase [Rhodococcus sp. EPR-157]
MKGIILAGGSGTRLHPITLGVSKQLLPVYDKPMIYYPLSVLMLAGITDIQIITTPRDLPAFEGLLGDGSRYGLTLSYVEQAEPRGLADAFLLSERHIGHDSVMLVLGDNIFHGPGFSTTLQKVASGVDGCVLFGYPVRDPQRYGVAQVDDAGTLIGIQEKPTAPLSNIAVTGLYAYDNDVVDIAKTLEPSARGELEITDVNLAYLREGRAQLVELGRGFVWLDTGTHESLIDAGQYVETLERRQGVRIACLEEVALRMNYIDKYECYRLGEQLAKSPYGQYVMDVASGL